MVKNKPEGNPLQLANGVAYLIPNDKIPIPSQLIWIRYMAGDTAELLKVASSLEELGALLPASCVWLASPLYYTEKLKSVIGKTPYFVASLPGLAGEELESAVELIRLEHRSQKLLNNVVSKSNAHHAFKAASENHAETAAKLENTLRELWAEPDATLKGVAQTLTNRRIPTSTGAAVWHATQVRRLLVKLGIDTKR